MSHAVVTLGADVGGKDAHEATHAHILAFRRLLADTCQGPYSETIKEIALVLRIDGSVQAWGKRGVEGVALQKRHTFATADIYITQDAWKSPNASALRHLLASEVEAAISAIAEYARHQGVDLLHEHLESDVHKAAQEFASL